MFNNLNKSDFLQLIAIMVTTITAIASIIIAIKTLSQNKKMIEESTRPYIVIYGTITNYHAPIYKLVLKNFGQSGGTITNFQSDLDLIDFTFGGRERRPFDNLENTFIAPGQSLICDIDYKKLAREVDILNFKIDYKSHSNLYNESIVLNVKSAKNLLSSRASTDKKELEIISYTLQDLVDKSL